MVTIFLSLLPMCVSESCSFVQDLVICVVNNIFVCLSFVSEILFLFSSSYLDTFSIRSQIPSVSKMYS